MYLSAEMRYTLCLKKTGYLIFLTKIKRYERSMIIQLIVHQVFIFWQDVHQPIMHVHVEYLHQVTPELISPYLWPINSPDLNPDNYKVWAVFKTESIRIACVMSMSWNSVSLRSGQTSVELSLMACIRTRGQQFIYC